MEVVTTKVALRAVLDDARADGRRVGLVPTMGALHDGHLSLISAARVDCDVVALTIFVNPLQFAAGEDIDAYPRPLERDLELAAGAGVTVAFTPSTDEMYPSPTATTVHVDGLTALLEGASRPTHFDGVTTVVTKLFNVAGPCRAYFGEKDFQQLAVVRRMVTDLDQPVGRDDRWRGARCLSRGPPDEAGHRGGRRLRAGLRRGRRSGDARAPDPTRTGTRGAPPRRRPFGDAAPPG
jgi:pantoate--beta-alanine ligase